MPTAKELDEIKSYVPGKQKGVRFVRQKLLGEVQEWPFMMCRLQHR